MKYNNKMYGFNLLVICATSIPFPKYLYFFVCFDLLSLQFSCPTNQPNALRNHIEL